MKEKGKGLRPQKKPVLRTSSAAIRKILGNHFDSPAVEQHDENSGIHSRPGVRRRGENNRESAAAMIDAAHLAVKSYKEEGNHLGLAGAYALLAEAEDPSSTLGLVCMAEHYCLAGKSMRKQIDRDKQDEKGIMEVIENEGSAHAFFYRAADCYLQASMKVDCLDTIIELFSNATDMYIRVSDYPVAYETVANAAEYQADPKKAEILSSVCDVLRCLKKGDTTSLERIRMALVAAADELSGKEKNFSGAAHLFEVLSHLDSDERFRIEMLRKAAVSYSKAGDNVSASRCCQKATEFSGGEDIALYIDLSLLTGGVSSKKAFGQ